MLVCIGQFWEWLDIIVIILVVSQKKNSRVQSDDHMQEGLQEK